MRLPSFDVIGSRERAVAIVEVSPERKRSEKAIARAIMDQHKNVVSVLAKASPRRGAHRLRKYRLIAGSQNTEILHKEHGCLFRLDPRRVYFSVREGTERERIMRMVKKRETVMVFFAGVGPFPIVIAKHAKPKRTIGIEINPDAVSYFRENVARNKVAVEIIEGDVKKVTRRFRHACDRIIMPLPESALSYLPQALACAAKGATIHLYLFVRDDEIGAAKQQIRGIAKKSNIKLRFAGTQFVLPYGPHIGKMRFDMKVLS